MAENEQTGDVALENQNYLGDPNVIDRLLRDFANKCIQRRSEMLDQREQSAQMDVSDAADLAYILLGGKTTDYPPMENWNKEGVLDRWLAQELPIPDGDAVHVVRTVLINFLLKMYQTMVNMESAPEEYHQQMVDGLVEEFTNLLIGNPDWQAE